MVRSPERSEETVGVVAGRVQHHWSAPGHGPPMPEHPRDEVQRVPYRPVQFRDDDLPTALERAAVWLRTAQQWLGEPLDVIAIHVDHDDRAGSAYYEDKLLCNEEDLAGAPIAISRSKPTAQAPRH